MDIQIGLLFSLFIIAILYGSVGHGGASGYMAIFSLSIFANQGPFWLKSHALTLNLIVAIFGLYHYGKQGYIKPTLILPFALTSIPFSYLGAYLPVIDWIFDTLLSLTLAIASVKLIFSFKHVRLISGPPTLIISLLSGAGIGLISGLVGVGGGVFLSPLFVLRGWATNKETAAGCALFILFNSMAGLAGAFFSSQTILQTDLMLQFISVVMFGGFLGTRFGANYASDQTIRYLLSIVLIIASLRRVLGLVGLWP
tara:strand:- start:37340 stop:38104 length:765 start_codon:yes stop_codon:yes gene_type:complete